MPKFVFSERKVTFPSFVIQAKTLRAAVKEYVRRICTEDNKPDAENVGDSQLMTVTNDETFLTVDAWQPEVAAALDAFYEEQDGKVKGARRDKKKK